MKKKQTLISLSRLLLTLFVAFQLVIPAQLKAQYDPVYDVAGEKAAAMAGAFVALAFLVPSPSMYQYKDSYKEEHKGIGLGSGFENELLAGRYLALGGVMKFNCSNYFKFKYGGGGSIKVHLGFGIPGNGDQFGGIYFGGTVGGGLLAPPGGNMSGGFCTGVWTFLGLDNIGVKASYDTFKNNEDPNLYEAQVKCYFGRLLTVSYNHISQKSMDGQPSSAGFLTLGISFRGDE